MTHILFNPGKQEVDNKNTLNTRQQITLVLDFKLKSCFSLSFDTMHDHVKAITSLLTVHLEEV